MTKRRPLNEQEKKLTQTNLKKLEQDMERFGFLEKYTKLMLDEGIMANALTKEQEMKAQLRSIQKDIQETTMVIEITKEQLEKGVEIKQDEDPIQEIKVRLPKSKVSEAAELLADKYGVDIEVK